MIFRRLQHLEQPLVEHNYLYAAYLILQLFAMLFLVGHWSACWWIELIHVDGRHESAEMADGTELYVYSLYLSFLSFMGQDVFAQTTKQRIFGLFTLSIGTTMYAVLLGKMAVVLTNVSLTATRQRHKRNLLLETMASMGLPSNLVTKVRKYLQLCIDTKRDLDGTNMLRELPDCIYSEIASHLYRSTILKVPMFRNCKKGFINAVAQMLLPEVRRRHFSSSSHRTRPVVDCTPSRTLRNPPTFERPVRTNAMFLSVPYVSCVRLRLM